MDFHTYFAKLVKDKDLSFAEIQRRLKKSQGYVWSLANGNKEGSGRKVIRPVPKPEVMDEIAKALEANDAEYKTLMMYSYRRVLGMHAKKIKIVEKGKDFIKLVIQL